VAAQAATLVQEDWDDGDGFKDWEFTYRCGPENYNLVDDPHPGQARGKVVRVENRLENCRDRARVELKLADLRQYAKHRQDFNWHQSVYVPKDWPTATMPVGWLTVIQIVPGNSQVGYKPDFKLVITKDHKWKWDGPGGRVIGPVERGQWADWVIRYKRSVGADGLIEVWLNGKKVINHRGKNTFASVDTGRWKYGIYASPHPQEKVLKKGYVLYFDRTIIRDTPGAVAPPPPPPEIPPPPPERPLSPRGRCGTTAWSPWSPPA
jgi:polysaccharide lyase-like protein